MRRIIQHWAGVGLFFSVMAYAMAADITLTTYYPSPRGVYRELRTTDNTYLATQGGNVGIGTTGPLTKFHVSNGASGFTGGGFTQQVRVENNGDVGIGLYTPTANNVIIGQATPLDQTSAYIQFNGPNRYMSFHTVNGAERMRIDNSGNVGIGTTGPSDKLEALSGNGSYIKSAATQSGSANWTGFQIKSWTGSAADTWSLQGGALFGGSTNFSINNNGNSRLWIDSSGNVGIGMTAPAQKLHVSGNALITGTITIQGGAPGGGKVLVSTNGGGDATWGYATYAP